jgi:hypothetical protein
MHKKTLKTIFFKLRDSVIFMFLLPLFFLLHEYVAYYPLSTIKSLALTTLFYSFLSLLIFGLFYLFTKKTIFSALLCTSVTLVNFTYGYVVDYLKKSNPNTAFAKYSFFLPAFCLLLLLIYFLFRKRKQLNSMSRFLNLLFLVLIMFEPITLFVYKPNKKTTKSDLSLITIPKENKGPDIYFIILDGYAGAEQTKSLLSFDNSGFYDSLTGIGFKNILGSSSNYNYTPYSTASILNMQYLHPPDPGNRKSGDTYSLKKINENEFVKFFIDNNYVFYNYSLFKTSGQEPKKRGSFLPTSLEILTSNTLISRLEKEALLPFANKYNIKWYLKKKYFADKLYNEHVYDLTIKRASLKEDKSKIVYTHLMMPHHPYYYDENEKLRSVEDVATIAYGDKKPYVSYMKYTNKKIIGLVNSIINNSKKPPLIVLISDHGFRSFTSQSVDDNKRLPFCNLMSVYSPDKDYSAFTDSLSNVNLLRIILNSKFGQRLPMLKDSTFFISF